MMIFLQPVRPLLIVFTIFYSLDSFALLAQGATTQSLQLQAKTQENAGEISDQTLSVGTIIRRYVLYTPPQDKASHPEPLMLVFHGSFGTGRSTMTYTRMNELACQEGFLVAYPQKKGWIGWNLTQRRRSEEVPYIQAVIHDVEKKRNINLNRIYVMGYSSGGDLVNILLCVMPDQLAGGASVSGNISKKLAFECQTSHPVPMLMINGNRDTRTRWNGSISDLSVPKTVDFWRQHNGCDPKQDNVSDAKEMMPTVNTEITTHESLDCKDHAEVEFVRINKGGHTWPGSQSNILIRIFMGRTARANARTIIWNFFSRHTLAERQKQELITGNNQVDPILKVYDNK